jgi:hypothetical protein
MVDPERSVVNSLSARIIARGLIEINGELPAIKGWPRAD